MNPLKIFSWLMILLAFLMPGIASADGINHFVIEAPCHLGDNSASVQQPLSDQEPVVAGWTVIEVSYDNSVDLRVRSAFNHACRMWEHILPPMLPIKINVRCEPYGANTTQYASVYINAVKDESIYTPYDFIDQLAPLAQVKYGIFNEYEHMDINYPEYHYTSFTREDLQDTDFEIVYNSDLFNQFSFLIETKEKGKYDFTTAAFRDIAKGFGFFAGFDIDNATQSFHELDRPLLPFECSNFSSDYSHFVPASGRIKLGRYQPPRYIPYPASLEAFAPERWIKGVSLSSLIPNSDSPISYPLQTTLSTDLYIRQVNEKECRYFLNDYLGWTMAGERCGIGRAPADSVVIRKVISYESIPAILANNGKGTFRATEHGATKGCPWNDLISEYLWDYSNPNGTYDFNLLRTDGHWELIGKIPLEKAPDLPSLLRKDSLIKYSRDSEGNLRTCVSIAHDTGYGFITIGYIFPIVYLPQQITMQAISTRKSGSKGLVYLALGNIEGAENIAFEEKVYSLNENVLLSSNSFTKKAASDLFRSYPDGTRVELTATPSNAYGDGQSSSYSFYVTVPVTIKPSAKINGNTLTLVIDDMEILDSNLRYSISSITSMSAEKIMEGEYGSTTDIEISDLKPGQYVLNYQTESDKWESFKFKKQ